MYALAFHMLLARSRLVVPGCLAYSLGALGLLAPQTADQCIVVHRWLLHWNLRLLLLHHTDALLGKVILNHLHCNLMPSRRIMHPLVSKHDMRVI